MCKRRTGLTSEQGHFLHSNIRESRGLYGTDAGYWVGVVVETCRICFLSALVFLSMCRGPEAKQSFFLGITKELK